MVRVKQVLSGTLALGLFWLMMGQSALAEGAKNWGIDFQEAVTPVMVDLVKFNELLLIIIVPITAFVLFLLIYIVVRFNAKANPTASKTTHNTMIEVVWTIAPILILVVIAIPSLRLLYLADVVPEPDMTIKATGNQWYWTYEYPDHNGIEFDAVMLTDEEASAAKLPRLLGTDTIVVAPVNKIVRVQVTASDVLHDWAMPAFGIKIDAVPGRLNETWFQATKEGVYYGQCSELCGKDHAFMPIMVKIVSQANFDKWAAAALDDVEEAAKLLARLEADQTKSTEIADASQGSD